MTKPAAPGSGAVPPGAADGAEVEAFVEALIDNLYTRMGRDQESASVQDIYRALAYTVRDRLTRRWRATANARDEANPRYLYFLSAEYLLGRQLAKHLRYMGTTAVARAALARLGYDLEQVAELDKEPGLGNAGLGRLAACFLDSLACQEVPCIGYGLRYELGIFTQIFDDGWQVERPDDWLLMGNPWEFHQPDEMVEVGFGGYTHGHTDDSGRYRVTWTPAQRVLGEPYELLIPGHDTETVNTLRLWRARATEEFDFQLFDAGDYTRAVQQKTESENISKVLYPDDSTPQGKELRLKQQYFFAACTLQDIIHRFLLRNDDWASFPDKVVVHLNDTHHVVAIPELMRILLDEQDMPWDEAWDIVRRTFAFTNHTVLPEVMERWPTALFGRILPRHLEIIYELNRRFIEQVRQRFPDDEERVARISILDENGEQQVRMAHLAVVGSFSVNGVAPLQTQLLRHQVLPDLRAMWPGKFSNKTNGVSARRFLALANPRLTELLTRHLGDGWLADLSRLRQLEPLADDADFRRQWREVKQANKVDLALYIRHVTGVTVDPASLFDVMAKRLHEYKRQQLKALHAVALYQRLKANPAWDGPPRTIIFGGKAAPGYRMAKMIIKLVNNIAATVNADPDIDGRLKVVYVPNFNVTVGEQIYPAAELSEQISMAGMEASGTGNMKMALNGALTVGTLDGANIEIRQRVGQENFFHFGLTAEEVQARKADGYDPQALIDASPTLEQVLDAIGAGTFSHGDGELFRPLLDGLRYRDDYMVLADFGPYLAAQTRVDEAYADREAWTRKSILNVARCGYFSSERAVRQYRQEIWWVGPLADGG